MPENEIIITSPKLNTDPYRDWTTHSWENEKFPKYIREMNVSPKTHPKAVDLCAGDGRWSVRFVQSGWPPENITCIDRAIPNPPLVEGLTWIYWDLRELGWRLNNGKPIPEEVERLKGKFDCVTTSCGGGGFGLHDEGLVLEFLARDGGFIWPDGVPFIKTSK